MKPIVNPATLTKAGAKAKDKYAGSYKAGRPSRALRTLISGPSRYLGTPKAYIPYAKVPGFFAQTCSTCLASVKKMIYFLDTEKLVCKQCANKRRRES
jgi:hypothetical protein